MELAGLLVGIEHALELQKEAHAKIAELDVSKSCTMQAMSGVPVVTVC
jgi:hypothetical protein